MNGQRRRKRQASDPRHAERAKFERIELCKLRTLDVAESRQNRGIAKCRTPRWTDMVVARGVNATASGGVHDPKEL